METYAGQTVRNRGNGSTGVLSTFTNLPTSTDACGGYPVGTTAESSVPGTALAVGRDVFEREVISDPRLAALFFITTSTRRSNNSRNVWSATRFIRSSSVFVHGCSRFGIGAVEKDFA